MSAPRILLVTGVTGAGKTAAALALARRLDGELVGADSVQVVRGFDIGSAKPTAEELEGVRHHLLDEIDPDEAIDAAGYAARADRAIAEIAARGRVPIVVGGTGLWIRALLRGLGALPAPDPALRAEIAREMEARGAEAMHAALAGIDPSAAGRIHPRDARRIGRALEVFRQTGTPLGALQDAHAKGAPRYPTLGFFLDRAPRAAYHAGLRERIAAMIARGWVEEVRGLIARWGPDVRPLRSVGYRQIAEHVRDDVPLPEAEQLAYRATRTYARRQRTWFRGGPTPVTWTDAEALLAPEAGQLIERFLAGEPLRPSQRRGSGEGG